jgi:hypothetical protein
MFVHVLTESDIPILQERIQNLESEIGELEDRERNEYSQSFINDMREAEYEYKKTFEDWRYYQSFGLPKLSKNESIKQLDNAKSSIEKAQMLLKTLPLEQKQDNEVYEGNKSNNAYINAKKRRNTAIKQAKKLLEVSESKKQEAEQFLTSFNAFEDFLDARSAFPALRSAPYHSVEFSEDVIENSMLMDLYVEHRKLYEQAYTLRDARLGFPADLKDWLLLLQSDRAKLLREIDARKIALDEAKRGDDRFPRLAWYEATRKKRGKKMNNCIGCNAEEIEYFIQGTPYGVCCKECLE